MKPWSTTTVFLYIFALSIPAIFLVLSIYNIYRGYPSFEELVIKKGVLEHVGKGKKGKNRSITWIALVMNGKRERIDIPYNEQRAAQLNQEIGNLVEVRYESKTRKRIKVWHVATESKVYLDYDNEVRYTNKYKKIYRNIFFILFVYTFVMYVSNHKLFNNYVVGLDEKVSVDYFDKFENITFKSSKLRLIASIWFLSIPMVFYYILDFLCIAFLGF